ncbi:MAG: DUF2802 domain-containing protein, partial [Gammaproteobacteria bacterium]
MTEWLTAVTTFAPWGLALAGAGLALWALARTRVQDEMLRTLTRQNAELRENEQAMGRRLLLLEKRFNALQRKHRELEAEDAQRVSYNEAVRLLQMGASLDELVDACGLSRA